MSRPLALLDSNVLVAAIGNRHPHHSDSLAVLQDTANRVFAVAAHSCAEVFVSLTRKDRSGDIGMTAHEAWTALDSVLPVTQVVGLTSIQLLASIRRYSESGGVGQRLYDALIGEAAIAHRIPAIITWNTRHMRGLFPTLSVLTPAAWLAANASG